MGYIEDLDNEDHPRNACAIRTALLLGANFVWVESKYSSRRGWTIEGINMVGQNKTMLAFMYLIPFGIGITKDARAVLCKDIEKENAK